MKSDIPVPTTQFDLTQQVSVVKSGTATKTINLPIARIVDAIRSGKYRQQMDRIRAAVAKGDAAHAKSLKMNLPGILWSGQFKSRKAADLIQHSGLIVADFDDLGDNLQSVRSKLIGSPHLLLLFISPSGNGLKAVFRVSADPVRHGVSFNAVTEHVYELTGVKIDPSGKDVSRLCFASYDPEIFLNPGTVATLEAPTTNDPLLLSDGGCCTDSQNHRLSDSQTHMTHKSFGDECCWILEFLPTEAHVTNGLFFTMARKSRSVELERSRPFSPQELRVAFETWYGQSRPEYLSESLGDYFEEFCRIRSYVRTPLDESPLTLAWRRSKTEPLPSESSLVEERLRPLLAFCAQLQLLAGTSAFYLSSHSAARFLGVAPMQATRWLRTLEGLGVLKCVKRGVAGKGGVGSKALATEYRYMGAEASPAVPKTALA